MTTRRTILLLSAKRCGSTAVFRMFQRRPDVGVCHVDRSIENWEPNFWNLAADAIDGSPGPFLERFRASHPFLEPPERFTPDSVFDLWERVLDRLGPIVFDKTPHYLRGDRAFELLADYVERREADVRIFAMIRDPRDAIASQFENWRRHVKDDSPERREAMWLEHYRRLERVQSEFEDRFGRAGAFGGIPLFRYEDFSAAPRCYAPMIFRHCGLPDLPESYAHVRPTHVGRYSLSRDPAVRDWVFSAAFVTHLARHGYPIPQLSTGEIVERRLRAMAGRAKKLFRAR